MRKRDLALAAIMRASFVGLSGLFVALTCSAAASTTVTAIGDGTQVAQGGEDPDGSGQNAIATSIPWGDDTSNPSAYAEADGGNGLPFVDGVESGGTASASALANSTSSIGASSTANATGGAGSLGWAVQDPVTGNPTFVYAGGSGGDADVQQVGVVQSFPNQMASAAAGPEPAQPDALASFTVTGGNGGSGGGGDYLL